MSSGASAAHRNAPEMAIEDEDTTRLVIRAQTGDREAFAAIYTRYFDRVYAYLRVALNDAAEAEDATQKVFMSVLESLPAYELREGRPFRAWLFRIARNRALDHHRAGGRVSPEDPTELDRRLEAEDKTDLRALTWTSDEDLLLLIERLPEAQRQALMLRYVLGFSSAEIAEVMERSEPAVRQLNHRALDFLRIRLAAAGREPANVPASSRRLAMRGGRAVPALRSLPSFGSLR